MRIAQCTPEEHVNLSALLQASVNLTKRACKVASLAGNLHQAWRLAVINHFFHAWSRHGKRKAPSQQLWQPRHGHLSRQPQQHCSPAWEGHIRKCSKIMSKAGGKWWRDGLAHHDIHWSMVAKQKVAIGCGTSIPCQAQSEQGQEWFGQQRLLSGHCRMAGAQSWAAISATASEVPGVCNAHH